MLKARTPFLIVEENQSVLLESGGPGFESPLVLAVGPVWALRGQVPPPHDTHTVVSAHSLSNKKTKSDLVRGDFDLKG